MPVEAEGSFYEWRSANRPAPRHHGVFLGRVRRNVRDFVRSLSRQRWPQRANRESDWMFAALDSRLATGPGAAPIFVGASVYRGDETVARALVLVQGGRLRVAWAVSIFDAWAALHAARHAADGMRLPNQPGEVLELLDSLGDTFPEWDGIGLDQAIMPIAVEEHGQVQQRFRLRKNNADSPFYRHVGEGRLRIELRENVPQRCQAGAVGPGRVRGDRLTCMRRGYRLAMKHMREGIIMP